MDLKKRCQWCGKYFIAHKMTTLIYHSTVYGMSISLRFDRFLKAFISISSIPSGTRYRDTLGTLKRVFPSSDIICLALKNVESKQRFKMEKNEDLDLLELQELARGHKNAKPHATLEQKSMIVRQYLQNHVPVAQLSRDFGVCKVTIHRWINAFANGKMPVAKTNGTPDVKPNLSIMPKKSQKPVETEAEELARLREENKRLAEALKMAEWMNHAKDVMIDEAEKAFNIPIRKKSGAKQ